MTTKTSSGPRKTAERTARAAIEEHGLLLVYPIDNRAEPRSLWSELYPGSPMRWAWDESADPRVVHLWHLREQMSRGRDVVYGKWYRGRAVFFSRPLFTAMLAATRASVPAPAGEARELLKLLEEDSPQSTKQLRRESGLSGRESERRWTHAMRTLWDSLSIVGTGEVEDGAFPSLAVGATRWLFEDLWEAASAGVSEEQRVLIAQKLPPTSAFGKYFRKLLGPSAPW